ncbi:hypothetical protein ACFW9D_05800 [Streptomyces sp. NPDC059524]|uniref:hypothetical protein n=1 Tax=Streptomyces sp. NPDC059524 TaxID=3346856 RepID=UPI0036D1D565
MSITTLAPATNSFANDPFYALGVADAYDEHQNGDNITILKQRATALLAADARNSLPAELYRMGYANTVIGLANTHRAEVTAQAEVAYHQARKERRRTGVRA